MAKKGPVQGARKPIGQILKGMKAVTEGEI